MRTSERVTGWHVAQETTSTTNGTTGDPGPTKRDRQNKHIVRKSPSNISNVLAVVAPKFSWRDAAVTKTGVERPVYSWQQEFTWCLLFGRKRQESQAPAHFFFLAAVSCEGHILGVSRSGRSSSGQIRVQKIYNARLSPKTTERTQWSRNVK